METAEAIKHMCETSGKGPIQVSLELGRSRTYVSASTSRGNVPRVDTLLKIAQACGYSLVLEGHGERIELEGQRPGTHG